MTLPLVLGIAGCIALLAGLSGGGFKAKEITVPKLSTLPRVLSSIGGLLLVAAAVFMYSNPVSAPTTPTPVPGAPGVSGQRVLTVQIWDVVQDQKNALVASEQFSTGDSETVVSQAGHWIADQITQHYELPSSSLRVHVRVPADLSAEQLSIEVTPAVPFQVYFWDVVAGLKYRTPVLMEAGSALANLNRDFDLEIHPVGYATGTVHVPWGQPVEQDLVLAPRPVPIAVENFSGEQNSYAVDVANYLAINSRFSIKDPAALQQLRDQIATEEAYIAANPQVQVSVRTSLGIDLLITGSVGEP